tara:strand:- start:2378 stop:2647 length:270 start_codon:yes stop_codon:yes gene_type:complete
MVNKKTPIILTKEQRQIEIRKIIKKLTELQLTIQYEPIQELFLILKDYVDNGGIKEINIPFPMINKRIKGHLPDTLNDQCYVALKHEDF